MSSGGPELRQHRMICTLCLALRVRMSLAINTAALAEPFLASFLKEVSCICPSPPVTVELMDRRVSKM